MLWRSERHMKTGIFPVAKTIRARVFPAASQPVRVQSFRLLARTVRRYLQYYTARVPGPVATTWQHQILCFGFSTAACRHAAGRRGARTSSSGMMGMGIHLLMVDATCTMSATSRRRDTKASSTRRTTVAFGRRQHLPPLPRRCQRERRRPSRHSRRRLCRR